MITKVVNEVIFEYYDDILSPEALFKVDEGSGYTTEIIYASGTGVLPFKLACTLDGKALHSLDGEISIKLPVPETHLADIDQLKVDHRGVVYDATPEGDYLVFKTDYI